MPAPLPKTLRAQFLEYIEEGWSARAVALRLNISPSTGGRWARMFRKEGHAEPAPQGRPKGQGKLAPYRGVIAEIIAQNPSITMLEVSAALHDATGVRAHHNSLSKFLRKQGYTYQDKRWLPPSAAPPK